MLIGASTAMAQTDTATTSSAATQTTTTASVDDPNQIVCKRMAPETGTRIGARQVCKTNAQWDEMHQQVHHDLGTYQTTHTQIGGIGH